MSRVRLNKVIEARRRDRDAAVRVWLSMTPEACQCLARKCAGSYKNDPPDPSAFGRRTRLPDDVYEAWKERGSIVPTDAACVMETAARLHMIRGWRMSTTALGTVHAALYRHAIDVVSCDGVGPLEAAMRVFASVWVERGRVEHGPGRTGDCIKET